MAARLTSYRGISACTSAPTRHHRATPSKMSGLNDSCKCLFGVTIQRASNLSARPSDAAPAGSLGLSTVILSRSSQRTAKAAMPGRPSLPRGAVSAWRPVRASSAEVAAMISQGPCGAPSGFGPEEVVRGEPAGSRRETADAGRWVLRGATVYDARAALSFHPSAHSPRIS